VESLPRKKKDPQKKEKKREQGLKSKRGETSYEEALCFKRKKRMKLTSC
jgi:hypothetical protein